MYRDHLFGLISQSWIFVGNAKKVSKSYTRVIHINIYVSIEIQLFLGKLFMFLEKKTYNVHIIVSFYLIIMLLIAVYRYYF